MVIGCKFEFRSGLAAGLGGISYFRENALQGGVGPMVKGAALRGEKIAAALPGWEVLHTGGGVFVAVKEFPLKGGGGAAVAVDGETATAHRRPDGSWVAAAEYASALGHVEGAEEVLLAWPEGEGFCLELAEEMFGPEAAAEVRRALASDAWE